MRNKSIKPKYKPIEPMETTSSSSPPPPRCTTVVIDTHFHADTNSDAYFIYGEVDEVAWYFTKNYPGKAVGTLIEVSLVVIVD